MDRVDRVRIGPEIGRVERNQRGAGSTVPRMKVCSYKPPWEESYRPSEKEMEGIWTVELCKMDKQEEDSRG